MVAESPASRGASAIFPLVVCEPQALAAFWSSGRPDCRFHLCPLVIWKSSYFPNFLSRPVVLG